MPSIFSHAIFASLVSKGVISERLPWSFWVLTALCAVLPDADAISFAFHVPYGSMWGHRGITHSIIFAVVVGIVVGFWQSKKIALFSAPGLILYFTLVTLSHPLLDMLTNGGRGIALLAPFSSSRYFFPWRPIEVSPIGMSFFSERGFAVLVSEIFWVWLPALSVFAVVRMYRLLSRDE